jgi:hypothetical protein
LQFFELVGKEPDPQAAFLPPPRFRVALVDLDLVALEVMLRTFDPPAFVLPRLDLLAVVRARLELFFAVPPAVRLEVAPVLRELAVFLLLLVAVLFRLAVPRLWLRPVLVTAARLLEADALRLLPEEVLRV